MFVGEYKQTKFFNQNVDLGKQNVTESVSCSCKDCFMHFGVDGCYNFDVIVEN